MSHFGTNSNSMHYYILLLLLWIKPSIVLSPALTCFYCSLTKSASFSQRNVLTPPDKHPHIASILLGLFYQLGWTLTLLTNISTCNWSQQGSLLRAKKHQVNYPVDFEASNASYSTLRLIYAIQFQRPSKNFEHQHVTKLDIVTRCRSSMHRIKGNTQTSPDPRYMISFMYDPITLFQQFQQFQH